MRKRMLSLVLTGIMIFTAASAEVSAAAMPQTPEEISGEQFIREQDVPLGGLDAQEAIGIPDEMAEKIGIVNEAEEVGGQLQYYSAEYGSQMYNTSWDVYSSNYLYNRLGTKERKFWDLLDEECRKYLSSTTNAASQTANGNKYYVTEGVEFLTLGLTMDKAGDVYLMFSYSNPQYYFLRGGYLYPQDKCNVLYPMVYDGFANGRTRKSNTDKVKKQIDTMKSQVDKGATDLEKARIAHDLIVKKVKYDHDYNTIKEHTLYHQSAYSVLCESYTVCAGYTKAFEILMNSEGIDTIGITSTKHAWNAICLNDSWYYVDCTWDDLDEQDYYGRRSLSYIWFGVSENTLTGPMDQEFSHRAQALYSGLLPKCTKDLGSTVDTVGTLAQPSGVTAAPQISQKKTDKGIKVTLTSATPGADIYYTTDGKDPSPSFSRSYLYTGVFTVNADVTLKAIAVHDGRKNSSITSAAVKGKQYTVKFDTMGGSKISAQKVWPQGLAVKPANPKRKGYTFEGWYENKKGTSKWKFSNKVTKDVTLYARWTRVKVKNTAVTKLKNKSGRKMDVTIQKVSDAKGYQIRYSTSPGMSSAKKVLSPTVKKTISGLKAGKTYYVQVRAYKLDSKKNKVYGKWSNSKKITIRK